MTTDLYEIPADQIRILFWDNKKDEAAPYLRSLRSRVREVVFQDNDQKFRDAVTEGRWSLFIVDALGEADSESDGLIPVELTTGYQLAKFASEKQPGRPIFLLSGHYRLLDTEYKLEKSPTVLIAKTDAADWTARLIIRMYQALVRISELEASVGRARMAGRYQYYVLGSFVVMVVSLVPGFLQVGPREAFLLLGMMSAGCLGATVAEAVASDRDPTSAKYQPWLWSVVGATFGLFTGAMYLIPLGLEALGKIGGVNALAPLLLAFTLGLAARRTLRSLSGISKQVGDRLARQTTVIAGGEGATLEDAGATERRSRKRSRR